MASQSTIDELVEYYVNLLIIQYNQKPKARATIAMLAEMMLMSCVFFDVQNGYNIDADLGPTAVGAQLDIIGKYVGVDRFYTAIDLSDYFGLVTYSEHAALPTSPPVFGASTYTNFGNFSYNGTLKYADVITSDNSLSDADFLTLILFMILCNNMNYSAGSIDAVLWEIFGAQVRAETKSDMTMTYFFTGAISTLLATIIFKGLLPAPMGVGINVVQNINNLMFGAVTYAQVAEDVYSPFAYGFSTYANYATLAGQVLEYSQISAGM